ncbi:hypothetical protein MRX96_021326 [Rhipicephalus microplus]
MRACYYPNGPHDDDKCLDFRDRWINESTCESNETDFGNMTTRDMLVSMGCLALFEIDLKMAGWCLTELLLCLYDFVEDKYILLHELDYVKTRDDIIKMMEDFKKCVGTTEHQMPKGFVP